MCLYANNANPLKGRFVPKFDKDGYTTCWKVYRRSYHGGYRSYQLKPKYGYSKKVVKAGWVKSTRRKKAAGKDQLDSCSTWMPKTVEIERGIHVFTRRKTAMNNRGKSRYYAMVPVRCHMRNFVAVSANSPAAVFTRVYLNKKDHDKAVSE